LPAVSDWTCYREDCERPGVCEICETCAEHCMAAASNDLARHRSDQVIASTDPKRKPS
jgi:hypothetical protein